MATDEQHDDASVDYAEFLRESKIASINDRFQRVEQELERPAAEGGEKDERSFTRRLADGVVAADRFLAREIPITAKELPIRIIAGGAIDAVNSTLDAMDDVASAAMELQLTDQERANVEGAMAEQFPDAEAFRLPTTPEPTGPLGSVLREGTEFIAAFIGPEKKLRSLRAAAGLKGKASAIAASEAAGALAAGITFDTGESLLGGMLADHPDLAPVVNEFMDAEDSALRDVETRLENSLIGVGFGLATRGVIGGIKAIRSARIARRQLREATPAPEEVMVPRSDLDAGTSTTLGNRRFRVVDPGEAATERLAAVEAEIAEKFPNLTPEEVAGRAAAETTEVEINLARINTSDDAKAVIQGVTNIFKERVDVARRGVRSNEETAAAADALGLTAGDVIAMRGGKAFTAEEALAVRNVHASAAKSVVELAEAATGPNASVLDKLRFRKGLAAFQAISEVFLGARAEAGRTLQQFNIHAADDAFSGRELLNLLDNFGGASVSDDIATAIVRNKDSFRLGQFSQFARKGFFARAHDAVRESFTMGLLWSPGTHLINVSSHYFVAAQNIVERGVAARIGRVLGREEAGETFVPTGEAFAKTSGFMTAIGDVFSTIARDSRARLANSGLPIFSPKRIPLAGKAAIESLESQREAARIPVTSKIDERSAAISSGALGGKGGIAKAIDYFGRITRIPGGALGVEDDLGKILLYRSEVHAQAFREAHKRGGSPAEIAETYASLVNDPSNAIRLAAVDEARLGTFTNDFGKIGNAFSRVREAVPFSFVVAPFLRTPAKMLVYSFERTPLAPLFASFRDDVAAGGARADIALAKMGIGSMVVAAMADLADMGVVHGAGPSTRQGGLREAYDRAGIKPNSIDIGGVNYTINRFDAIGTQIALGATLRESYRSFDHDGNSIEELLKLVGALGVAAGESATSKSWLMGVSQVVDVVRPGGSEGPGQGEKLLKYLAFQGGNFVPFSSALRLARDAVKEGTPELNPSPDRLGRTLYETITSQLPILEASLPRRLTIWGEEHKLDEVYGRPFDLLVPTRASRREDPEPIDLEIINQGFDIRRIAKRSSFNGVMVDFRVFPLVYERYAELAGNKLIDPATGKGTKDSLNDMVQGKGPLGTVYRMLSDGPEGAKVGLIKSAIARTRNLAQLEILDDNGPHQGEQFEEFRGYWNGLKREATALKMPVSPSQQIGVNQ